jgi:peptidoglycan/xylan/chitin deacetylase (PgdA/CDA1 family)
MILWSIDTLDWETLDADTTVQTVLDNVKDGDIILMHDIYSTTVDAAQILIPTLIEEGYDLVTIHELAEIKGVTLTTGTTYGEFYLE